MASFKDRIFYTIATGLGSGLSPVAPGTVGSLVALVLIYGCWPQSGLLQCLATAVTTLLGVISSGWLADSEGVEDPPKVVIDEFAGMAMAFWIIPDAWMADWKVLLVGFLAFRAFDIWKPWPICKLEELPGGWGIMMDDVLAGVFAGLSTYFLFRMAA